MTSQRVTLEWGYGVGKIIKGWNIEVFKNDNEVHDRTDILPYTESEIALFARPDKETDYQKYWYNVKVPAVLGNGIVKFCGYEDVPMLFVRGMYANINPYVSRVQIKPIPMHMGNGLVEGCKITWVHDVEPDRMVITLTEPDGTKWTAKLTSIQDETRQEGEL